MPSAEAAPSHPLSPDELAAAKRAARSEARRLRAVAASAPDAARAVRDRVLSAVPVAADAVVAGYWPIGDELDVRPLLGRLHDQGRACALPVASARGQPLTFRRWKPDTRLAPGTFGVPEPGAEEPEVSPTVLLVPLLAFDRRGYRLGYGAGFYDRTLAGLRARGPVLAIGIGLSGQELPAVPRDRYDEPLDWLVTELFALKVGEGR